MATIRKQITVSPMVAEMLHLVASAEGESESGIICNAVKEYTAKYYPELHEGVRKQLIVNIKDGTNND